MLSCYDNMNDDTVTRQQAGENICRIEKDVKWTRAL